jgi:hypothetical protein
VASAGVAAANASPGASWAKRMFPTDLPPSTSALEQRYSMTSSARALRDHLAPAILDGLGNAAEGFP